MAAEKFGRTQGHAMSWVAEVRNAYRVAAQRQLTPIEIGAHRGEQVEMVREVIAKAWQELVAQEHKSASLLDAERTLERIFACVEGAEALKDATLMGNLRKMRKFLEKWEPNHRGRVAQMNVILGAIRLLGDLTGTVVQKVEVTGADGGPIEILERMNDAELDSFLAQQGVHLTLLQGGKSDAAAS